MIDFLTYLGKFTSAFIVIGIWVIAFMFIDFHWQCGLCGKTNTTNLFKLLFQMCDHEGI